MKRIIKLILTLLLTVSMFLPNLAQTVKALPIMDVTISSDGIATWNPVSGAERYSYVWLNSAGYIYPDQELKLDLTYNAIHYGYESGTYEMKLYAEKKNSANEYEKITEVWTGQYTYTSKGKLRTPTNLRWEGNVAKWNSVNNADAYRVYLYRDEATAYDWIEWWDVSADTTEMDFTGCKVIYEGEKYYFGVMAQGRTGYANSEKATSSSEELDGIVLRDIENIVISPTGVINWDEYEGAESYYWRISYSGGTVTETTCDLYAICKNRGWDLDEDYKVTLYAQAHDSFTNTPVRISNEYETYFHYDEKFTVTFDNNGIDATTIEPAEAISGTRFPDIFKYYKAYPKPSTPGLAFDWWYWHSDCDPDDIVRGDEAISGNVTLYANFVSGWLVTFNVNGNTDVIESQSVADGGYATKPETDPDLEGYVFGGWYADPECTTDFNFDSMQIKRDTVIYAKFNEIINLVEISITAPVKGEHPDREPVAKEPDKYSVEFSNWYLNESPYPEVNAGDTFEGNKEYVLRVKVMPKDGYAITSENTEFLINGLVTECFGAVGWRQLVFKTAELCNVTFVTNGDTPNFEVKVEKGGTVERPADPVREGFRFVDWCADASLTTAYEFSTIINEDISIYGSWKQIFTHQVTFLNYDNSDYAVQYVIEGETATKPADPERVGYKFVGWVIDPNDDVLFDFSTPIMSYLYLYSKWELIPEDERDYCFIEFNSNGGGGTVPETIKVDKGSEYTLPECMFTPFPGTEFGYWSTISIKENATLESELKPGTKIKVEEDIQLMAMWVINTIRLAGANRYETAIKAAEEMKARLGVEKFNVVILTTGDNFADALSGGFLAARNDAPILLTRERSYETVNNYIKNNLADGGKVYVLGGVQAVPEKCLKGLEGFTIKRIAGANRYETNLKILDEADAKHFAVQVCTGNNFADSLSASATGLPIILVKDELSDTQKNYLKTLGTEQFYVIGGKAAVSDKVIDQLKKLGSVKRVAGNNRYETSVEIAKEFFGTHVDRVVLAYAKNFPDGLAGGPLGFEYNAPVILTMTGHEAEAVRYCKDAYPDAAVVMGGSSLISDTAVRKILDMKSSDKIIEK